jgi:membrane protein CcdC involved in cytochrome C biogenesis
VTFTARYNGLSVTVPHLHLLSLVSSITGAIAVLFWRIRETQTPVSFRKIIVPPLGMATGFAMFVVPMFRVPFAWALAAFAVGALVLAYPLLRTSRLVREGDVVMMERSNAFLAIILVLAAIRIGARGYLDTVLSIQQTAGLFFILAFGMILRWRAQMLIEFRALASTREEGGRRPS